MNLFQIAKLLEILGFLLATFFGSILLNKEFFKKLVDNINNKLISARDKLNNWYVPYTQYLLRIRWFERIVGTLVVTFAEIFIVLGWLVDIKWLFWLGLITITPYAVIVPLFAFLLFRNNPRMSSLWQFPAYLFGAFVKSFILVPIVFIPFLIFIYFFTMLALTLNVIAKEDFLKKVLIISGSVIVVIGLTLELIASWS